MCTRFDYDAIKFYTLKYEPTLTAMACVINEALEHCLYRTIIRCCISSTLKNHVTGVSVLCDHLRCIFCCNFTLCSVQMSFVCCNIEF